jgi:hypothetical protein
MISGPRFERRGPHVTILRPRLHVRAAEAAREIAMDSRNRAQSIRRFSYCLALQKYCPRIALNRWMAHPHRPWPTGPIPCHPWRSTIAHPTSSWTKFAPVLSEFDPSKSQSSYPLSQLTPSRIPVAPISPFLASPPGYWKAF